MPESDQERIISECQELVKEFPDLSFVGSHAGGAVVTGVLAFSASFEDYRINDDFQIEIIVPKDYPKVLPIIHETGGRIPREEKYHANKDGSLCLEVPVALRRKFESQPTLTGFVEKLVIHFLYSFSRYQRDGVWPFGEWQHGGKGILEFYQEEFNVKEALAVIGLLRYLADDAYRGHHNCPCDSGKKLRKCHGPQLIDLSQSHTSDEFLYEYSQAINSAHELRLKIPREHISSTIAKQMKKEKNAP